MLWRHLRRNSLITVVTLVGLSLPVVITGTLLADISYAVLDPRIRY